MRSRIGLAVVALLAALGLAELGFRGFVPDPVWPRMMQVSDDDILGIEPRPGADVVFEGLDTPIPPSRVRINSAGFRGGELIESSRRLVCIGDSTTFGWGVEDDEPYCPLLAAALGPQWSGVNLGVPGYNATQAVRRLEVRGVQLRPDLVVYLFDGNDFEPPIRPSHEESVGGILVRHSALARWVAYRVARLSKESSTESSTDAEGQAAVVEALQLLGRTGLEAGFEAVVFFDSHLDGRQILTEALDPTGVFYARATVSAENLIPDDGHPNSSGQADLAKQMSVFLRARRLDTHTRRQGGDRLGADSTWEDLYQPFLGFPAVSPPRGEPRSGADRMISHGTFEIDAREVSSADFTLYADKAGIAFEGTAPRLPASNIDWDQAAGYCASVRKRLPTEAEWELAAAGPAGRRYPWGNGFWSNASVTVERLSGPLVDEAAWRRFFDRYEGPDPLPAPVDSPTLDITDRGVAHMHGNVGEWVAETVEDRGGRAFGRSGVRIVKGVGITTRDYGAPLTTRFAWPKTHRDIGIGFRCAADIE